MDKLRLLILSSLLAAGCGELEDPPIDEAIDPVLGTLTIDSTCATQHRPMLEKGIRMARIAAVSPAFEQCLDQTIRTRQIHGGGSIIKGPYLACSGDPYATFPVLSQVSQALAFARSPNALNFDCHVLGAPSWAGQAGLEEVGTNPERFTFNQTMVEAWYSQRNPGNDTFWYPYWMIADTAWHEVMHQHAYDHRDAAGCGQISTYDMYIHSMPYIVGGCMREVFVQSAERCGSFDQCGEDALPIVDAYGGTTCSCVQDIQGTRALGVLELQPASGAQPTRLRPIEKVVHQTTMASTWYFRATDGVQPIGDVDGDGNEDLLVRNSSQMGLASFDTGPYLSTYVTRSWGSSVGGWTLRSSDTFQKVGDMTGDGRAEILVRNSTYGIAILSFEGSALTSRGSFSPGTWIGSWCLGGADTFPFAGDFNGDGRKDILVRSTWGIGVITYQSGAVTSIAFGQHGTWLGSWFFQLNDNLDGAGNFNNDARDELVVRSSWGMGILAVNASNQFHTLAWGQNNTWVGGWFLQSGDFVRGVADLDGNGRSEMLLKSNWGLGFLGLDASGNFALTLAVENNTWLNGWRLGVNDLHPAFTNVGGDSRAELVVRSSTSLAVLQYSGGALTTAAMHQHDSLLEGWRWRSSDVILGTANIDGQPGAELIVRAP